MHHALRMDLLKDSRKHLAREACALVLAVPEMHRSLAQMSYNHHGLEVAVRVRAHVCTLALGSREEAACHGGCRDSHREKPRCWLIRQRAHAAIRCAYSCDALDALSGACAKSVVVSDARLLRLTQ